MYSYSELLKGLINFAQIKFVILANALGYDVSYISKWCNGAKLPSQKYCQCINDKISDIFAEEIIEGNLSLDFFTQFNIPLPGDKEKLNDKIFIKNQVFDMLQSSYKASNPKFREEEHSIGKSNIIIGSTPIKLFLQDTIQKEVLLNPKSFSDIYITLSITSPVVDYLLDLIDISYSVNIKIGLDLTRIDENYFKKLWYIYNTISKHKNLNIEIFNCENFKYLNTIVAKDNFAINFGLDNSYNMQIMTYTNERSDVEKVYKLVSSKFNEGNILFKGADSKSLNKSGYRTDFYSGEYFNIFSVCGFEFLAPANIIEKIAETAASKDCSIENIISIEKTKITWEEVFQERPINFFIVKSSLYKYLEDGRLVYMDTDYITSADERKQHIEYVLKIMEKNPKIKIYIIDDEQISKGFKHFDIGVFTNNKKFFTKNYEKFFRNMEPFIKTVIDKTFVDSVNRMFEDLKTCSFCKEYTCDDLKNTWTKYESMFTKIMNINKNQ